MLAQLINAHTVLAPMALNSDGIQNWLLSKLVPIVLCVLGLVILAGAGKGNWSKTFSTTGVALVGIIFIVGAGAFVLFGQEISGVVLGGGGKG